MGRVFESLSHGESRFLTGDDDYLPMTDEALDEYAYEYEQLEEVLHGKVSKMPRKKDYRN